MDDQNPYYNSAPTIADKLSGEFGSLSSLALIAKSEISTGIYDTERDLKFEVVNRRTNYTMAAIILHDDEKPVHGKEKTFVPNIGRDF
ncbi:hypothetical protein SLA2020_362860 [Shorea laevis]